MKGNTSTKTSQSNNSESPPAPEEKAKPWWQKKLHPQAYDKRFFDPYVKEFGLDPQIPDDYYDHIYEQEFKLLKERPKGSKLGKYDANIGNLFKFYDKKILPKMRSAKILIGILIPTGDGGQRLNSSVAMTNLYKPPNRIHTITGHNIGILRNQLVNMAYQHPDTTHFFFLDSDVVLPPFALMRLVRRTMEQGMDIVSGIYTMKGPPYAPLTIKRPRNILTGARKFNYYFSVPETLYNKVVPCDGTGAGCLLITRKAIEKMGPPWFQVTPQEHGLSAIGEDLFFFDKAQDYGFTVWLDLSIQNDHVSGTVSYPRVFYMNQITPGPRSKEQIDMWNRNAILDALNMPLARVPSSITPYNERLPEVPVEGSGESLPQGVEQVEVIGDSKKIKQQG